MLSEKQKADLLLLIELFIGEDASISRHRTHFNDATVDVVERMIDANKECNQTVRKLFADLANGGQAISRGWLKSVLGTLGETISASDLNGYGCRVTAKSKWKTAIILSAT